MRRRFDANTSFGLKGILDKDSEMIVAYFDKLLTLHLYFVLMTVSKDLQFQIMFDNIYLYVIPFSQI